MATFVYKAKKNTAETVTGQISAQTQDEAIDLINQLGLLPVAVEEQVEQRAADEDLGHPRRIRTKELYVFSRQLANLIKSGVSLLRSLVILQEQTENGYFKKVISQIVHGIKNGKSFSECLLNYPAIFSPLYVTMIRAGEESGNLQDMLVNVSEYQKRQDEIVSKVKMALAYPVLMAIVGIATVAFILTFVFPKLSTLFQSLGDSLPLPTIILLNISKFLGKFWYFILIGAAIFVIVLKRWFQSVQGKLIYSYLILKFPLFGEIILKSELSRFCRTLVMLLKSGVSLLKSLQIAIPILNNEIIKDGLLKCKESLAAGGSLGESLKKSAEIPSMMGHLITVAEESGQLNDVLLEIANTYEQETTDVIKVLTTLLEPIMILVIGLIIGFMVFAMLLPIFQMDVLAR